MKKTMNALIMVAVLVFTTVTMVCAAELDAPEKEVDNEEYQYAQSANAYCSVSGGTATSSVSVNGKSGTTKIVVSYSLQKKSGSSWSNVATWSKTVNGKTFSAASSKAVSKGYSYRTKATITVYKGSLSETFTKYSSTVSY